MGQGPFENYVIILRINEHSSGNDQVILRIKEKGMVYTMVGTMKWTLPSTGITFTSLSTTADIAWIYHFTIIVNWFMFYISLVFKTRTVLTLHMAES